MNDDEVFEAVKKTLSDVQMGRPVEAIEQRGRTRKRNRGLFGAVAGGALAAAAALALTLPGGSHQAGTTAAEAPATGGTTAAAPAMQEAAFTLAKLPDGSTKLTLDWKHILNPQVLQKALEKAGIPAVVKTGELCTPKGEQLPEAKEVFKLKDVSWPDGSPKQTDLLIATNKMPKGSVVYFSVFAVTKGGDLAKDAVFLVQKNAPMSCRTIG